MNNNFASFDEYGFQHFAVHLRNANQREALYQLLLADKEWMDIKSVRLMGDASYVNDLDSAMDDLVDPLTSDEALRLTQLRAARQIVDMRVNILTDLDLKVLVSLRREPEALSHARLRSDDKTKFASIFFQYNSAKEAAWPSSDLLSEAVKTAWSIGDSEPRAYAFSAIAKELSRLGRNQEADLALDEAERAAIAIEYDHFRWKALGELADAYAELRKIVEAIKRVRMIPDNRKRMEIFCNLADVMITTGQTEHIQDVFREILQIITTITDDNHRASALRDVLNVFVQGGQYSEIRNAVRGIPNDDFWGRSDLLGNLAVALATKNREEAQEVFAEAKQESLKIKQDFDRTRALSNLVQGLAASGFLLEAERLLVDLEKSVRSVKGWKATSPWMAPGAAMHEWVLALIATGNLERAKSIALVIGDSNSKSRAINDVAAALTKIGRLSEAEQVAGETPNYYGWKERTLGEVAEAMAWAGKFAHAEKLALANPDSYAQAVALSALAIALAKAEKVEEAIRITKKISEPDKRVQTWRALAQVMVELQRYEDGNRIFEQMTIDASQFMKFDEAFPQVLIDISLALDQAKYLQEANRAFVEARNVALKINIDKEWSRRLDTLRRLAIALAETGRISELRKIVLAISSKEGDETPKDQSEERWLQGRYVDRASALRDIAIALANNGHIAESTEVAKSIDTGYWSSSSDDIQAEAFKVINGIDMKQPGTAVIARSKASINKDLDKQGQELAAAGKLGLAFARIGLIDPNRFLETILTWQPAFERLKKGLSVTIIEETMRIMAWVHPGWQRAYDHIYTSHNKRNLSWLSQWAKNLLGF